jgi:putative glutamine amidotransferase
MTQQKPKNRRPRILVLEGLRDSATAVRAAGAETIVASPREASTLDVILAGEYDGILLTGGGDVNPRRYGAAPRREVYGVNNTRDYVEMAAIAFAKDEGLPVLGICRGMQIMAIANGGRLNQHIGQGHRNTSHLVWAERGSFFRRVLQSDTGYFVSLHHQRVTHHGPGFEVAARCRDGAIEAIESKDGRCLGVQWHPEIDAIRNPQSRAIFRWLILESAKRAGLVRPSVPKVRVPRAVAREQLTIERPSRPKRPKRIESRWFCRSCGFEFDEQSDRDDHEYWLCGERDPEMSVIEPPAGHPDTMTEDAA